jgi:MYXO-CTERM domain-containing protein
VFAQNPFGLLTFALALLLCFPGAAFAYTVQSFAVPDPYDRVLAGNGEYDALFGIDGYDIENFEGDLATWFTLTGATGTTSAESLDNTFWDLDTAYYSQLNLNPGVDTVFTFNVAVFSIGIGLSDFHEYNSDLVLLDESGLELYRVDDVRTLNEYPESPNNERELYVRIDADAGDTAIRSLVLDGQEANAVAGWDIYDRLAISTTPVPEPSAYALALLELGAVALRRRRARAS